MSEVGAPTREQPAAEGTSRPDGGPPPSVRRGNGLVVAIGVVLFGLAAVAFGWNLASPAPGSGTVVLGDPHWHPTTVPTPQPPPPPAPVAAQALAPATSQPSVPECSETVDQVTGGRLSPLFCPDGGINVLAWEALAKHEPAVMRLGPGATQSRVLAAMCADLVSSVHASVPQEMDAEELAARYNSWTVTIGQAQVLSCPGARGGRRPGAAA